MQTIITKYIKPGETSGSKIRATTEEGKSLTVPYIHHLNPTSNHQQAAIMLGNKLEWKGKLCGGHMKTGMVWVLVDDMLMVEL